MLKKFIISSKFTAKHSLKQSGFYIAYCRSWLKKIGPPSYWLVISVEQGNIFGKVSQNNTPTVSSTQDLLITRLNAKFKWAYHTNSDRN